MEDYKGIYPNIENTTKYYEFGAHFKYLDLYESLEKLITEKSDEMPSNEDSPIKIKKLEEKETINNRKKYKLNTSIINDKIRYRGMITDTNEKENNKNEISIIEEEKYNDITNKRKKRNKLLTKSYDVVKLPKINTNNIAASLRKNSHIEIEDKIDINNIRPQKLGKSFTLKRKSLKQKKEDFPKIHSLYYSDILRENQNNQNIDEETHIRFKENNASVKIFNVFEERDVNRRNSQKRKSYKIFDKISGISNEKEYNKETENKPNNIKYDKLQSIFEKEKERKKYNLYLGKKNDYSFNNRNIKNDYMAQHIHNLNRSLLSKEN